MAVPVSLEDAKLQLRCEGDDQQDYAISGYIVDAAAWVEKHTGHILEARDVTEVFGSFSRLELDAWPIAAGAVPIVTYAGADGNAVAVTGVHIARACRPARLAPWVGTRWPSLPYGSEISVTVRAGYEDDDVVPGNFRRAMLILISAYDADREGGETFARAEAAARSLCRDYRRRTL